MNARAVQDINDRQNDVEHIRLLQAADVEHAKAQRVESARWGVALILSVAGLAAVLFPDLRVAAAIIGVVFAVLTEIVWPLVTKNSNNRAVLIQEQFDTSLFQIPWNPDLGRPVPLVDVADAAARYGKGDKRNWYLDVRGIPSPIAETLCQRENLIWDADQREAWAWRLVAGLSAWLAVGLTVSLAAQWYVWQLLAWYIAPTLPAAALALRSLVQQRSVARTKIELRERIDDALQGLTPHTASPERLNELAEELRTRQDKIFRSRLDSARVPERFYNRLRSRYESNHQVEAEHFKGIWAGERSEDAT
ncbi:S-4TM family putative pore-forming effector [Rhodococcus sp. IITD102]|uniref:S-4TM family putative pore-forming effector n=1 Tax=Rhodococcus TaxID=1827 RepID=UPI0009334666